MSIFGPIPMVEDRAEDLDFRIAEKKNWRPFEEEESRDREVELETI